MVLSAPRAADAALLGGPDAWAASLGDEFTDCSQWERAGEPDGYVWGVRRHVVYPGIRRLPESTEAGQWSSELGVPFHTARVETNVYVIELVCSDSYRPDRPWLHRPPHRRDRSRREDSARMTQPGGPGREDSNSTQSYGPDGMAWV